MSGVRAVADQLQSFPKAQAPDLHAQCPCNSVQGIVFEQNSVQGMFKYQGMQLPTSSKSKAFSFFGHLFKEVQVQRLHFLLFLLVMLAIAVQSLAS